MDRRSFLTTSGTASAVGLLSVVLPNASAANSPAPLRIRRLDVTPEPLQTKSNDLTPYAGTWGDVQIRHALRRAMCGVRPSHVVAARELGSMQALVERLIDASRPLPLKPATYVDELLLPNRTEPEIDKINKNRRERSRLMQLRNWWFDLILQEDLSIREKMTLMWHNHFVVSAENVQFAGLMYTYLNTLRSNALGNIKKLTYDITVDPAMLIYLNGNQSYYGKDPRGRNVGDQVNENYARELMELFTLGILDPVTGKPNYTEADIQNAAQALSGWQFTLQAPFKGVLVTQSHNSGPKTFFGQTGNWGAQDIIDMIFAKNSGFNAAYFLCEKIYTTFVYYVPNKEVVTAMAQLLVQSNWEVAPVLKALFSSDHFYDENVIGAQLRSALEFSAGVIRDFNLQHPAFNPADPDVVRQDDRGQNIYRDTNPTHSYITNIVAGVGLGQTLLEPPNVKGWPGGHHWISTGTYPIREAICAAALSFPPKLNGDGRSKGVSLKFEPVSWANAIRGTRTVTSREFATLLTEHISVLPLGPKESQEMYSVFNSLGLPEDDFYIQDEHVAAFAMAVATLPEYQLV